MQFQLEGSRPIWQQLTEQLTVRIVTGAYPPGSHFPTVRELAAEAGVNPNTMQRALSEMERRELVFSQRTAGRYVTADGERIRRLREELAGVQIRAFLEGMERLGFRPEEIGELLRGQTGGTPPDGKGEREA